MSSFEAFAAGVDRRRQSQGGKPHRARPIPNRMSTMSVDPRAMSHESLVRCLDDKARKAADEMLAAEEFFCSSSSWDASSLADSDVADIDIGRGAVTFVEGMSVFSDASFLSTDMKQLDDSFNFSTDSPDMCSGPASIPGFDSPGEFFRQRSGFLGSPSAFKPRESTHTNLPQPILYPATPASAAPPKQNAAFTHMSLLYGDEQAAIDAAGHRSYLDIGPLTNHVAEREGVPSNERAERTSRAHAQGDVVSFVAAVPGQCAVQRIEGVEALIGARIAVHADQGTPFSASADARQSLSLVFAPKSAAIGTWHADIFAVQSDDRLASIMHVRGYTGSSQLAVVKRRSGARTFFVANHGSRDGVALVVARSLLDHVAVNVSPSVFVVRPHESEVVTVECALGSGGIEVTIYMLDDVLVAWGRQDALVGRDYDLSREHVQSVSFSF